jgi:hypothetical protein
MNDRQVLRNGWLIAAHASVLVPLLACAAGDGIRFQIISMERPPEGVGLPPPADYAPCYQGEARGYDLTGDGKVDEVRVTFKGRERCYGEDTDHDGVIDTWDLMDDQGHLVKRASDTNGDGRFDRTWTFDPINRGRAAAGAMREGDAESDSLWQVHLDGGR